MLLRVCVASSGRLFGRGEWLLDDDPNVSPLNRWDAIPCSEDQDVSQRSAAKFEGAACNANTLEGVELRLLLCCRCTLLLSCAGRDGSLLGIGETALEGAGDNEDGASYPNVFVSLLWLTDTFSSSYEIRRRFRGRKVAEVDVDVVACGSVFMAAEAHVGLSS